MTHGRSSDQSSSRAPRGPVGGSRPGTAHPWSCSPASARPGPSGASCPGCSGAASPSSRPTTAASAPPGAAPLHPRRRRRRPGVSPGPPRPGAGPPPRRQHGWAGRAPHCPGGSGPGLPPRRPLLRRTPQHPRSPAPRGSRRPPAPPALGTGRAGVDDARLRAPRPREHAGLHPRRRVPLRSRPCRRPGGPRPGGAPAPAAGTSARRLGSFAVPTLVGSGLRDPVVAPEDTAELALLIPGAERFDLPHAAHSVLAEGGGEALDRVVGFLASPA